MATKFTDGIKLGQPWRKVLLQDPCVYCGGVAVGLDHIVARTKSGANAWWNRAPACARCDSRKGNTLLLHFLLVLPALLRKRRACAERNKLMVRPVARLTATLGELTGASSEEASF